MTSKYTGLNLIFQSKSESYLTFIAVSIYVQSSASTISLPCLSGLPSGMLFFSHQPTGSRVGSRLSQHFVTGRVMPTVSSSSSITYLSLIMSDTRAGDTYDPVGCTVSSTSPRWYVWAGNSGCIWKSVEKTNHTVGHVNAQNCLLIIFQ